MYRNENSISCFLEFLVSLTFNSTFVNASMDNKLTYEEQFLVYYSYSH